MTDKVKDQDEKKGDEDVKGKDKDEACPPLNFTCPTVDPCPEIQDCPPPRECRPCQEERPCPEIDCHPCKKCGPCPEVRPCQPCPVENSTVPGLPPTSACPEAPGMSLPAAVAVGVVAGILLTGVATTIGVILRYLSPIESGFISLSTIVIIWYLCSHHPETARELGGRAATLLREAATALSHRVVEALRHHNEQVGFPVVVSSFLLF